jgi:hypothetical protein
MANRAIALWGGACGSGRASAIQFFRPLYALLGTTFCAKGRTKLCWSIAWAPRKIGPGTAFGSIHSSYRSECRWTARTEPEFFEVPLSGRCLDRHRRLTAGRLRPWAGTRPEWRRHPHDDAGAGCGGCRRDQAGDSCGAQQHPAPQGRESKPGHEVVHLQQRHRAATALTHSSALRDGPGWSAPAGAFRHAFAAAPPTASPTPPATAPERSSAHR